MTTYLLAGGGTAGHVNPLLATADRIMDREPDATVLVLGTREGLESRLVPERGYELLTIARLPFPRRPNRAALGFPAAQRRAIAEVRAMIEQRGVDVVVGFGGYASAPAYLAARGRVPFVIHEANARPGLANRLGARFTPFVGVVFENTPLPHATVVGMPLRREVERLDREAARAEARELFGLDAERPVLLVTGGSTGARSLNRTLAASVELVLGAGWQVLHIVGSAGADMVDPEIPGYRMLRYCDRMELALAVADFAVSRAGAATVAELTLVGVPSVLVPYPVGNGEQRFNARGVVDAGGALLVLDADFTPEFVRSRLVPILSSPADVAAMALGASVTGEPGGADRMVDLVQAAAASAVSSPAK
jgi:UDP-N-acetylglucosamine--N-acetylmuramyl-(pentapeptide) pyrophosphoryl-undecaprenol N-acetylglucosamine transferase